MSTAEQVLHDLMSSPHQLIELPIDALAARAPQRSSGPDIDGCVDFWGLGLAEDGSFSGRQLGGTRPDLTLRQAAVSAGEWTGLFRTVLHGERSYVYLSDFYGMGSAFWTLVHDHGSRILILSNSFRAILAARRRHGAANSVHWESSSTTLLGTMNIFLTPHCVQTPAKDVWLLRSDEALVINGRGIRVTPRQSFYDPALGALGYEGLLRRGLEKACRGLTSVVESAESDVQIMLSGGKDSRCMLAVALAAGLSGRLTPRTHAPTIRPPGPMRDLLGEDQRIATGLAARFGLEGRGQSTPRSAIAVSFEEHLDFWQSHRSGWNYTFAPGSSLGRSTSFPQVQLWGAGGELMRGYFTTTLGPSTKNWEAVLQAAEDPTRALQLLYDSLIPSGFVPTETYWNSRAHFISSMIRHQHQHLPLAEMVDNHYRNFRHAAHFGNRNMAWELGTLQWYPLCQPEFVMAAALLEPDERVAGKAQFDLIEAVEPELNDWELQGKQWDPVTGFEPDRTRVFPELKEAPGTDSPGGSRSDMLSTPKEIEHRRFNPTEAVLARLADNLEVLRTQDDGFEREAGARLLQRASALAAGNPARAGHLLAKTESLRDVVECPAVAATGYSGSAPAGPDSPVSLTTWTGHPDSPAALLGNPLASLSTGDDGLIGHVRVDTELQDRVEWSWYLFAGSTRVLATPYSASPSIELTPDEVPTRAVVFIRSVHRPALAIIQRIDGALVAAQD